MTDPDPLDGQEIQMLNQMLAALHPKARAGDEGAIDRVIKILELKRRYKDILPTPLEAARRAWAKRSKP